MPSSDTQWKKGQSGNPKGRTPRAKMIPELLRENVSKMEDVKGFTGSRMEVIIEQTVRLAMKGVPWAVEWVANRMEGRATETVRHIENAVNQYDGLPEQQLSGLLKLVDERRAKLDSQRN